MYSLHHKNFKKELNEDALKTYLCYQYSVPTDSFFKNVHKLNPGHCFIYKDGKMDIRQYFKIEYQNNDKPGKATARVTFQGNFTGIMSIPFNISDGDEKTIKKLRNISMISADEIVHGNTVTVISAAKGGSGEYKFAVFYKKVESEKWVTVHGYNDEPEAVIKPKSRAHYRICVKAKDSQGSISKNTSM